MVKFLDISAPLPPSWSLLLNKAYVINGHLANPPSPLNCPRGLWMTPNRKLSRAHRCRALLKSESSAIPVCMQINVVKLSILKNMAGKIFALLFLPQIVPRIITCYLKLVLDLFWPLSHLGIFSISRPKRIAWPIWASLL